MKQRIILLGAIVVVAIVAVWAAWRMNDQAPPTNTSTNNINQISQNIGITQTSVPSIVFTGTVVPFATAFVQPETAGWKTAEVFDSSVSFHPQFFPCSSTLLGPQWYLILTADCANNQDAHSIIIEDITDKVKKNDTSLQYLYAKDVLTTPEHQFRSDEIRGTVNDTAIWCYDDAQARYCELKRPTGQILFVTGGYFNESTNPAAHHESFVAIVRGLLE